jgi:hypothetical protein
MVPSYGVGADGVVPLSGAGVHPNSQRWKRFHPSVARAFLKGIPKELLENGFLRRERSATI